MIGKMGEKSLKTIIFQRREARMLTDEKISEIQSS
jgi:hypothetical protein